MQRNRTVRFPRDRYLIHEGRFWNVILRTDKQTYLGRSIVYLKRTGVDDPLRITAAEHRDLWNDVLPRLARALHRAFKPDRVNYAHLANRVHRVHWHVIPRYEHPAVRRFAGRVFRDPRPGHNYAPDPFTRLPSDVLQRISENIRKHFPGPGARATA